METTTGQRKQYDAECKARAGELMAAGRPVAELAEELRISPPLLYSWRSSLQGPQTGNEKIGADDANTLRREITRLREENAILKAAAAFSSKTRPNLGK